MPAPQGLPTATVVPPHHAPAALFVVVLKMQFVLGCLCGVMFSASSLVLSLDRSVGGRLGGGLMFMSTVLSGTILGGALVSLHHCSKCCMGDRAGGSGTAEVCAACWRPFPPLLEACCDPCHTFHPPGSSRRWRGLLVAPARASLPTCLRAYPTP